MRIFLLLFLVFSVAACVSPKKVELIQAAHDSRIADLNARDSLQTDSIYRLTRQLISAEGGNDALLRAQSNLEDKLVKQKDELDNLSGNLSNTSSRLSSELTKSKAATKAAKLRYDTLLLRQAALIEDFQARVDRADSLVHAMLDTVLTGAEFRTTSRAGELVLSVQEDVLFKPRSVSQWADRSAFVFRAVMDVLQADPLLKLTVVGHTDNTPNPRRGTDNWQYAALRATAIADELAATYYLSPNRLQAASQGEYAPLTSNATEEGRALNRRVDFVLRNNVGNLVRELGRLGE